MFDPILPDGAVLAALFRVVLFAFVLVVSMGARAKRHWPVPAGCAFLIGSNVLFLGGELTYAGLVSIPFMGIVAWLMIDRLRSDPINLHSHLAAKEEQWRHEYHELQGEIYVLKQRLRYPGVEFPSDKPDKQS